MLVIGTRVNSENLAQYLYKPLHDFIYESNQGKDVCLRFNRNN